MSAAVHPLAPELRPISGRDLVWLLASLALVIAPHALRAPWWLTVLTVALVAWRVALSVNRAPLPSRWTVLALALLGIAGVWAQYHTIFGRTTGIVLLMLFAALKLLEMRNHRDAAVAAFLCYFLIITNLLYSQTIPTAALMLLALVATTGTLVSFNAPHRASPANLRTSLLLLAHAAPAALALFVLFPRVSGPFWAMPQDASSGLTGLSDSMSPGNLAKLARSDAVAFRAEFSGALPPQPLRYWRGPVLWDFDGRTWRAGREVTAPFSPPASGGRTYRYSVVLEPHNRDWLFALETASSLPPGARFGADGELLAIRPVRSRVRYRLTSVVDANLDTVESPSALRRALRLPPGFDPQATALAQRWRRESASDAQVVSRAIAFFRGHRFTYTLEPPPLGRDSVDEFLFDTRAGFCEHFASAFTFLMRAAGIPSRVVTGYQGGELNTIDNVVTVRQSDAHAWSEVYLAGRGWVRVDPTAAAVPGRVESGISLAVRDVDALPLMMRPQMQWLRGLRDKWDAVVYKWNVWVLGYNPDRQRDLMAFIGMRNTDWRGLTAALFTVLGVITTALLVWSLRRIGRPDAVQKSWRLFCRKLAGAGIERAPYEGPRDYSERAARALPSADGAIRRIGRLYIALRYGAHAPHDGARDLRRLVRELSLR